MRGVVGDVGAIEWRPDKDFPVEAGPDHIHSFPDQLSDSAWKWIRLSLPVRPEAQAHIQREVS